jgi:hypothetical protein
MAVIPATGTGDVSREPAQEFFDWLSGLQVTGIVVALLFLAWPAAAFASRLPRAQDKVLYLALGAAVAATIGATLLRPQPWIRGRFAALISLLPVAVAVSLGGPGYKALSLALAVVQAACVVRVVSRRMRPTSAQTGALLVLGFVSWSVALEMFVWEPMRTVTRPSLYLAVLTIVAIAAAARWAFGPMAAAASRRGWLRLADALAVTVIVLLAFRTDGLFATDRLGPTGTFYHWGVLVTPAQAVRHGGWLFWDVSSPYGFLITLVIAAFPAATAWEALYLLNAAASALLATWLYLLTRERWEGLAGTAFALAIAVAVVFLASNYPPTLAPEHYFPQSGPFRFGLCYLLAGILLIERSTTPRGAAQLVALAAGALCWIASILWSLDVAAVASLIWYPSLAMIVWRDARALQGTRRWGSIGSWLIAPPLALGLVVWIVLEIYRIRLGHVPNLFAYVEIAASFVGSRAGKVATVLANATVTGTVLPIVLGILLLATAVCAVARQANRERDLPLLVGLTGGVWGFLSYAVAEPFVFAFCRLMPFLVLGLTIVLSRIAKPFDESLPWLYFMRVAAVALIAGVLVSAYGNATQLAYYASAIRHERFIGDDVTRGFPTAGRGLETLLRQAGVKADDRLFYTGNVYGDTMPAWNPGGDQRPVRISRQWLAGPVSTMVFRSDERKRALIAHAIERQREGGWLIERRDRSALVYTVDAWFFEEVNRHFTATRIASDAKWRVVRYEPAFGSPADDPAWSDTRVPDPSDGLFSNGRPVRSTVTPDVWGYFGHEPPGSSVTLHLFSPTARSARLIVSLPQGIASSDVDVTSALGETRVLETERSAGRTVAGAHLSAGWNTFVFETPAGTTLRIGRLDVRY